MTAVDIYEFVRDEFGYYVPMTSAKPKEYRVVYLPVNPEKGGV